MTWSDNLEMNSPAYNFAKDSANTIRIVAGPGTGKSYALRKRIARLLEEGVKPQTILAVTFTRTAAQDLKNEISSVGVDGSDKIVAKTLHSFCFSMLNSNLIIESTGRYPRPMLEHELKPMLYDINDTYGYIRDKEKLLREFEAMWARLQTETPNHHLNEVQDKFEKEVLKWLAKHKAMLFGEMIRESYKYLHDNPQCDERKMFKHVLVDEYQDLNKAEQAVIDYLASEGSIAIIGDDDQSIYSFKYAHPEGIREFPDTHSECDSIEFNQCYRCPKKVVSMASKLISNNANRTLGSLTPCENNSDGNVKIIQFRDLNNEIEGITNLIREEIDNRSINPQDVLILVPVRKIGYRMRDSLVASRINAKSYFRESALKTDATKNIFSLINLAARPNDLVAWRYLLGEGSQNYRNKSYRRVLNYAEEKRLDITTVFEKLSNNEISIAYTKNLIDRYREIRIELNEFVKMLDQDRNKIFEIFDFDNEESSDLQNIIISIIEEIGLMEEEDCSKWLEALYNEMVEYVSYPQQVTEQDHVRIMSLHASKGLSAKFVVIMSCIEGLLPRINFDLSQEEIEYQIEEQRRLFYVALTRCKCTEEYQGTLIISSFIRLPGNEALQINIPADPSSSKYVRASRFISEFQETAPSPVPM